MLIVQNVEAYKRKKKKSPIITDLCKWNFSMFQFAKEFAQGFQAISLICSQLLQRLEIGQSFSQAIECKVIRNLNIEADNNQQLNAATIE
ncbi:hypothetical protein SUGI_0633860 [Cryptomeria japonica]|nr:hypothetical protein SUGI_0633860 [Cryptomeria japonica]